MSKILDNIINKHLHNVLIEANIDVSRDNVLNNAQKRITSYLKELIKNGDSSVIQIMNNMGYNANFNKNEVRKERERIFNGSWIADELTNDIIKIVKILQQYVNGHGGINLNKLKDEHSNDYNLIMRIKNFLDLKGLTFLYDKSSNIPSRSYGINWNKGEDENNLDFNQIKDSELPDYRKGNRETWGDDEIRNFMKQKLIDQYMEAKYGMSLEVPNITFSNGNGKLPNNVLIVNFTSAINCPAWNECLVKHACYARAGEKQHRNVYISNENRSLFWRASENDPKLLNLLMEFIRSYCFNFNKVASELIKLGLAKGTPDKLATKMSRLQLSDSFYTPEIIEIMKQNKRMDYIRLNENGDFIGQWLVDAWENEATEYLPYDIHVSAYTCRHLNYDGIKNLILNTSFVTGNGNVARHFIALPQDVYDALDETYGGPNNTLIIDGRDVEPNPQPLYDVQVVNGKEQLLPSKKMYYKCPCGRGKKKGENKGVNCYQCSLCYQPKASDDSLYVFVAAHGGSKEQLNGYDLIENRIGVSKNFFNYYKGQPIIRENDRSRILNIASRQGIQGVAKNAISSVYQHFRELDSTNMNETQVIKLTENEFIDIVKNTVSKLIK